MLEIKEFRCYEVKIEESTVHIEDCEGWWLSSCCSSVAEHWRLKVVVSLVQLPAAAGLFTFLKKLCAVEPNADTMGPGMSRI